MAIQGFIGNESRSILKKKRRRIDGFEVAMALLFESEESEDVARSAMSREKKEDEDVGSW
ncbi:hypothetical protein Bca101_078053 [Brassica carinata]